MKKIAVDLRPLESPTGKRGVGYFNRHLFKALLEKPHPDFKFNLFTFPNSRLQNGFKVGPDDKFQSVPALYWPKKGLRRFDPLFSLIWSRTINTLKPDLLHIPFLFDVYYLAVLDNIRVVVTLYDTIPLTFPKEYFQNEKAKLWYMERLTQAKKAAKIITISKSSKKDIERLLEIPPEKIKVIYGGIDQKFKVMEILKIRETLRKYKIKTPYILTVSTHSFHKNIERIFQAFKKYMIEEKNAQLILVVVCRLISGEKRDWVKQLKELGIEKRVILTNFVEDDDLPAIYNGAKLFLFPSLYEGLGLPILEAQACGCPVITSNISSMPEVAGKGAILVDPYSTKDIIRGVREVREIREELIKKGFENVKRFSWEKCARETLEVYREILQGH
ncbi:glycosyltransferase family 4 protein [Candidatus Daviesbacteria bacterium]|nr:glycosyltransferase family 4 protein [Candidatus Daviesbacteria bacterium]